MTDRFEGTNDARVLEKILEVSRRLAAPFELTEMLNGVIEAARSVLRADRGSVFLYESETNELVSTIATGVGSLRFPADRGIVGECLRSRQIINVPDCYADKRFNQDADRESGYRTRCLLTLPLIGYDDSMVGVMQLLNKEGGVFDAEDEKIGATLAAQCAVALQRVRMTEQIVIKEKQDRELAVARGIQMDVLPRKMPNIEGYQIAGMSTPADETGGDIFDLVKLKDGRLVLLLGDATGHGIGPALSVTQVRAMLRIALRLGADISATFSHINDQLADDLADNRFVTGFLGALDPATHRLSYHAGGQAPLLHFHASNGKSDWHDATTVPMGFMGGMKLKDPSVAEMQPGDVFGMITDGVFEYEDRSGEQFGIDRVAEIVRGNKNEPIERVMQLLLEAVRAHGEGVPQADDITIVLLRRD